MTADSPNRYLVNMSKSQRSRKIFLDYLRNDRKSTAVAPLSPSRPSRRDGFDADHMVSSEGRAGNQTIHRANGAGAY